MFVLLSNSKQYLENSSENSDINGYKIAIAISTAIKINVYCKKSWESEHWLVY